MRRVAIVAGIALILCVALALHGGPASDVTAGLSLGWLSYLARVIREVRIAWDGLATGVLCLTLFTVGLHRTLSWFHGELRKAGGAGAESRRHWSFRWTAALVALIVVMFVVGISATGVVHQVGWLIAARRSLVEEKTLVRDGWGSSVDHLKQIGMGSYFLLNPEVRAVRSPEGYALSHYAGNVHVLGRDRAVRRVGPGDAANTILAGEVAHGFKPWGDPTNLREPGLGVNKVSGGFGGPSGSGANFLFVDGSVRFLRDTASRMVLHRLSVPRPTDR